MIAASRPTDFRINDRIHVAAQRDRLAQKDLVRTHALHWLYAAEHIGNHDVVVIGIEPTGIADLAARIGIKRSMIEHDLYAIAGNGLRHSDAILHDGEH